jgi:hypothetical protein
MVHFAEATNIIDTNNETSVGTFAGTCVTTKAVDVDKNCKTNGKKRYPVTPFARNPAKQNKRNETNDSHIYHYDSTIANVDSVRNIKTLQ